jgi:hypothetical protein
METGRLQNKMFKKKSMKKLEEKINRYILQGDYFNAAFTAENSGFKELEKLADKYYQMSIDFFMNKLKIRSKIGIDLFPLQEAHQDVLDRTFKMSEYSLDRYYIRN